MKRAMYQLVVPDGKEIEVRILFDWYQKKNKEDTSSLARLCSLETVKDKLELWGCTFKEIPTYSRSKSTS